MGKLKSRQRYLRIAVMKLWVLLVHQLFISPALCSRPGLMHLANMHVFESFISCSLAAPSVLCTGQCSQACPCPLGPQERSWCEGESQCLETLQGFCSRLLCSLHVMETLSQACVSDHIKLIRWRLSATQIKHTGADKQMLTASVSRHLPVCFLR